jgi:hypothetical protein
MPAAERPKICSDFSTLLRMIVARQDEGDPVFEQLLHDGNPLSLIHQMMEAAHTMRLRMINEGLPVRVPPSGGGAFLGFASEEERKK